MNEYLTDEQIFDALCEMGETGSFRVRGNDLLIKREENVDERFYGAVESKEQVESVFESIE